VNAVVVVVVVEFVVVAFELFPLLAVSIVVLAVWILIFLSNKEDGENEADEDDTSFGSVNDLLLCSK
jgi:hypothetical protein